jgi:hypothetical protein
MPSVSQNEMKGKSTKIVWSRLAGNPLENGGSTVHTARMAAGFRVAILHPALPPQVWYAAFPNGFEATIAVTRHARPTIDESIHLQELPEYVVDNLGLAPGEVRRG